MYNTKTTIKIQIKIAKDNHGIIILKQTRLSFLRNLNLNRNQFLATLINRRGIIS